MTTITEAIEKSRTALVQGVMNEGEPEEAAAQKLYDAAHAAITLLTPFVEPFPEDEAEEPVEVPVGLEPRTDDA